MAYDYEEVLRRLESAVQEHGSANKAAQALGITFVHVSNIRRRKVVAGLKTVRALGLAPCPPTYTDRINGAS